MSPNILTEPKKKVYSGHKPVTKRQASSDRGYKKLMQFVQRGLDLLDKQ